MAILIADVQTRLRTIINDEDKDFWENDQYLLDSLNEAQIAIMRLTAISQNPGRGTTSDSIALSGLGRTYLPADAYLLIQVIGNTNGRAVTKKTFEELAAIDPCWQTATPIQGVEHYAYDPSVSGEFWVYPGAATGLVTATYIKKPKQLVSGATELDVDDQYLNDVINYCLYRAYQREGIESKWEMYRQSFYSGLMQKLNIDEKEVVALKNEIS